MGAGGVGGGSRCTPGILHAASMHKQLSNACCQFCMYRSTQHKHAVLQIYKERKNLAYTLQDARGVVSKLELIMGVMMHVLFVFFYLIIFDVRRSKSPFADAACRAGHMHLHCVDSGDSGHLCTLTHSS